MDKRLTCLDHQNFQGEASIIPGFFWFSNIHQLLSFVTLAQSDMLDGTGPGAEGLGKKFEWSQYERLVTIAKNDLDSLEYNLYHTTVTEVKKVLWKMIIPALIENQALPGFVTQEASGRLLGRLIGQTDHGPKYNMDDIINVLSKVNKAMKSFHIEEEVISQVFINELLKLIGSNSFNDMLMRRNFASWKRGESCWRIGFA
jgi:myosin-5